MSTTTNSTNVWIGANVYLIRGKGDDRVYYKVRITQIHDGYCIAKQTKVISNSVCEPTDKSVFYKVWNIEKDEHYTLNSIFFEKIQARDIGRLYVDENSLSCVRIYNKKGEHKLSLLPCGISENGDVELWDIASPDGKVHYCGVENDLVDVLAENLGFEPLNK